MTSFFSYVFKFWNLLIESTGKTGFVVCARLCFLCLIKIVSLRLDKVKGDKAYELEFSRMLADLYKVDFRNNTCIGR